MEKSCLFRILGLAFATEALYCIPYQLPGIFRPIFLGVFDLTNENVGVVQATYGAVNMLMYLPGGYLADRVQPRTLMSLALLTSAACGACLLKASSNLKVLALSLIWAAFAVCGNLLYWSPLVASIRQLGGEKAGLAFGAEQCSRGLVATVMSTGLLTFLGRLSSSQDETLAQYRALMMALVCILVLAAMVSFCVAPSTNLANDAAEKQGFLFHDLASSSASQPVWKQCSVWLMGLVILAAYTGNLATGLFAGLAHDAYGMKIVDAGRLGTVSFMLRAVAPCLSGAAADRFGSIRTVSWLFVGFVFSFLWLAMMPMETNLQFWLPVQAACASAFAFGLAAVYFTLLDELGLPQEGTGAAVGAVSAIGFLPDIFVTPMAGYFLDHYPGQQGYRLFMLIVASLGGVGLFATRLLAYLGPGPCNKSA